MRTTTLDIFVDILQRLRSAGAFVGITTTMEMDGFVDEDDDGNEILVEAGPAEVSFVVEETIAVDDQQQLLVDDAIIEDAEEDALFDVHTSHETDIAMFCALLNEFADAGFGLQTRVGEEDVRVLDIEHIENNDGLTKVGSFLSRGRFKIQYIPFESEHEAQEQEACQAAENIPSYHDFVLWYNEKQAHYRVYPRNVREDEIEDVLDYYRTAFVPMIQAARDNGEIPGLIFH